MPSQQRTNRSLIDTYIEATSGVARNLRDGVRYCVFSLYLVRWFLDPNTSSCRCAFSFLPRCKLFRRLFTRLLYAVICLKRNDWKKRKTSTAQAYDTFGPIA